MAEATTETEKPKPDHKTLVAVQVKVLNDLLEGARQGAIIHFVESVIAGRDQEWMVSSQKTAEVYHKIGMLEAVKLICPACARGTPPLRSKVDEKSAGSWTHHPEKDGKPDKTIGTICLAAVIHETLEAKK